MEENQVIESTGVESQVPAAEVPVTEVTEIQPGAETPAAAEPHEKAFAKRLAAEREKWQKETEDRYKNYDAYERATKYLLKQSGIDDPLTLREQIEMAELQEQAMEQNVPVEVLQRLQTLEQKAQKADEYERQQQQQEMYKGFRGQLDTFAKEKGVEADTLEQYMIDNKTSNIELAYKAMRADDLEKQLSNVAQKTEADTIRKLQQNAQSTPGSVAEGAGDQPLNFAALSREQRAQIAERVKRGEIRSINDIR